MSLDYKRTRMEWKKFRKLERDEREALKPHLKEQRLRREKRELERRQEKNRLLGKETKGQKKKRKKNKPIEWNLNKVHPSIARN